MEQTEYRFYRTVETDRTDYRIRDAVPHDKNFVLASWKRSYFNQRPERDRAEVIRILDRTIAALEKAGMRTLVACSVDRPDFIHGFVCFDSRAVHYVFVRESKRRNGVATELVREAGHGSEPTVCTYWTRAAERLTPGRLHYRPSLLLEAR